MINKEPGANRVKMSRRKFFGFFGLGAVSLLVGKEGSTTGLLEEQKRKLTAFSLEVDRYAKKVQDWEVSDYSAGWASTDISEYEIVAIQEQRELAEAACEAQGRICQQLAASAMAAVNCSVNLKI